MIGREDGKEGGSDKFVKPRLHAWMIIMIIIIIHPQKLLLRER